MSNDFEKRNDSRVIGRVAAMAIVSCLLALFLIQSSRLTGEVFSEDRCFAQIMRNTILIGSINIIVIGLERAICQFLYYHYLENSPLLFSLEYMLDGLTVFLGTVLLNSTMRHYFDPGISLRVSYMTFLLYIGLLYGITSLFGLIEFLRK